MTAPAVRANAVVETEEIDRMQKVMFDRTEKLLSIAALHGHKVLVLGAWGSVLTRQIWTGLEKSPHL